MNYKQTGAARPSKGAPKFDAHKTPGKAQSSTAAESDKAALLARMKAAADKASVK